MKLPNFLKRPNLLHRNFNDNKTDSYLLLYVCYYLFAVMLIASDANHISGTAFINGVFLIAPCIFGFLIKKRPRIICIFDVIFAAAAVGIVQFQNVFSFDTTNEVIKYDFLGLRGTFSYWLAMWVFLIYIFGNICLNYFWNFRNSE